MGRRRFGELLASLGILPATVASRSRDRITEATDDPTEDVPIVTSQLVRRQDRYDDGTIPEGGPEYEPVYETVSRDEWVRIRAAEDAVESLLSRLRELDAEERDLVDGALNDFDLGEEAADVIDAFSVSKKTVDGEPKLFVDCPPGVNAETIESLLPSRISGAAGRGSNEELLEDIPVEFREREVQTHEEAETGCRTGIVRYADAQYRERGIAMGAAARSETLGSIASTGFRALRNGRAVLVTTGHTFYQQAKSDLSDTDVLGAELYQADHPHSIGKCRAIGYQTMDVMDAAIVPVDTKTYPSRYLASSGGDNYADTPITGAATWQYLEAREALDLPIYKQGSVTGRCRGQIEELRTFSNGHREIVADIHSSGGDSGGPYFIPTVNGYQIAGIHKTISVESRNRNGVFVGSILDTFDMSIY